MTNKLWYNFSRGRNRMSGFTIVELLIVIVVIGILATITIVAYTGIQSQVASSVLKSDLKNADLKLALLKVDGGEYPSDTSSLTKSGGTTYEYDSDGETYCLTAWSNQAEASFHIENGGPVEDGPCDGHTGYVSMGFTPNGGVVTTLAGGRVAQGDPDGTGSGARFAYPWDVVADSSGNVYVSDNSYKIIRKVTPEGVVTTLAGLYSNSGYVDAQGSSARFSSPRGIAMDGAGNLYVADSANHAIRKITMSGDVTTFAGNGVAGSADGNGTNAQFNQPYGLAFDSSGNLWVADTANYRIRKITPNRDVTTYAGLTNGYVNGNISIARFGALRGITFDDSSNMYIADTGNNRIRKITTDGTVSTISGSDSYGAFRDGDGLTLARFDYPADIEIDPDGNIYVVDIENNRIRKITPSGDTSTFLGATAGYLDSTGTAALFKRPRGFTMTPQGVMYVADTDNNRIRKVQ